MARKKEVQKKEELSDCVVDSDVLKFQRLLKYYHGRLKGQVGVVRDDVALVLDVCREMSKVLGDMSENGMNKVSDLAFECLKVTADRDAVKSAYEDLASEYEDLKAEYDGLKEKFGELVEENDSLRDRLSKTFVSRLKRLFHLNAGE